MVFFSQKGNTDYSILIWKEIAYVNIFVRYKI
ncbi:hypothetical protein SAMN05444481_102299 [Flavobacterium frigidimaris]|nr:hypothetical protein SAMN05444481_102299 [Flavobacterium frigidimaris]